MTPRQAMHVVAIALAGLAMTGCFFTRGPRLDERPRWELQGRAEYSNECIDAKAFVRKSGREGFGMAIQLVSKHDCHVRISSSWLLRDASVPDTLAPVDLDMRGRSLRYAWLPVRFDNLAAWNRGVMDGQLTLLFDTGASAAPQGVTVYMRDVLHQKTDEGGP